MIAIQRTMRCLGLFMALLVSTATGRAAESTIVIPTDAGAKYTVLEVAGKWPNRTIVTKRVGSSATSFSRRLYNCSNHTVKYLGTGDTLAEMTKSKPDAKMAPIASESIADYVGRRACRR